MPSTGPASSICNEAIGTRSATGGNPPRPQAGNCLEDHKVKHKLGDNCHRLRLTRQPFLTRVRWVDRGRKQDRNGRTHAARLALERGRVIRHLPNLCASHDLLQTGVCSPSPQPWDALQTVSCVSCGAGDEWAERRPGLEDTVPGAAGAWGARSASSEGRIPASWPVGLVPETKIGAKQSKLQLNLNERFPTPIACHP